MSMTAATKEDAEAQGRRIVDAWAQDVPAFDLITSRTPVFPIARDKEMFDAIAAKYPPRIEVDLDDLADALSALADGGIILSRSLQDVSLLPRQILQYRAYVRLVFLGP